ncbi:YqaJ viral recombinase family protein [Virgibacillus sp. M23]|uniref:YqaJ viral recombinase family nuclease n=1 Tax=Virgibacillus sp. M23 TaxID=3079030 RepID=UPI002A91DE32|nr:YqaJ viral recombinase family protein [Virgibacillus sp. M23]MDY7044400.1 YqaJ viral recombinase family protein [Virgibacillus sp. M23]
MAKNTIEMSHQEWLQERTKGIGGSDASIILGLNKYRTPFELWLEKTGQTNIEDTAGEAAYFGNLLEDMVAKEFEVRSGKKVRRNNFMLQHPQHSFIMANIDRKVVGENALLECKTASMFLAKDWDSEEIPEAYLVQVQHYLGVTGYEKAYIAVLIGGQKFVWKEIERDDELIQMIFDAEVHFWNHHVLGNNPPALDGSSAAERFLKERYAESDPDKVIDLSFSYKEKLDNLLELKQNIKQLQELAKQTENQIKNELQDAETGFVKNYQVNWKPVKQNRVDSKLLKSKYPDVYNSVLKTTTNRRLNVKEIG